MNYSNIRDKTKHLLPGAVLIYDKYDKGVVSIEYTNQKICFFPEKSDRCFSLHARHLFHGDRVYPAFPLSLLF